MKKILPLVLVFALILAGSVQAQGEEPEDPLAVLGTGFTYQGWLTDDAGSPLNGTCDFNFSLWDALTGGAQVGAVSPVTAVTVTEGYFSAVVNGAAEFGSNAFKGSARWLEVSLRCPAGAGSYTTLSPRQALTAAPYARYAANAPWSGLSGIPAGFADGTDNDTTYAAGMGITLSGGAFSLGTAYRLPQSCTDGQIAEWDTGSSLWTCGADNTNSGDITGVTAGSGLTGGGTSGGVTLALGTAYQLPQSCTDGQIAEWDTGTSLWVCAADNTNSGDITGVTAGTGLTGGGTSGAVTLTLGTTYQLPQSCANGQPTEWNNITRLWTCGTDSTGSDWHLTGNSDTDPASNFIGTTGPQDLIFKVNGQTALRIEPDTIPNLIGGYNGNSVTSGIWGATIGGGGNVDSPNAVTGNFSTVSGGLGNIASHSASVGGGSGNLASGAASTVGGGSDNQAIGVYSTVSGGSSNIASGQSSTVGGGSGNEAIEIYTTIGGGYENYASGQYASVAGGYYNTARGDYSFVAGNHAQNNNANHDGVFLFADSNSKIFTSIAANQFRVRATGGVQFITAIDGTTGADTAGVEVAAGGGSWSALSDRSLKSNFASVDSQAVLKAVAGMPISTWNYTAQEPSIRHIGPMAQDFYAAFNVGEDERHITTIDADGVALAAIQGLNEVVEEKDVRIISALEEKEVRISALEAQVARLQNRAAGQTAPLATPWPWLALCVIVLGLAAILRRPAR